MTKYTLTVADQGEARHAFRESGGSSGQHEYLKDLRTNILALAERGNARGYDHVHLSQIDGTDFVVWMGRAASGYHYPIGRFMRLVEEVENDTATVAPPPAA